MNTREALMKTKAAIHYCETLAKTMKDLDDNSRTVSFFDTHFEDLESLKGTLTKTYEKLIGDLKAEIRCDGPDDLRKEPA